MVYMARVQGLGRWQEAGWVAEEVSASERGRWRKYKGVAHVEAFVIPVL